MSSTGAVFVVVVTAIASTRPVLAFAELCLGGVASLGGRTPSPGGPPS